MTVANPRIIVVTGPPACGKTKLGKLLAENLHMAISDKDHVTGQLLAAMMKEAGYEGEDYSQTPLNKFRKAIYGCMEDVAKDNLKVNMGTVIISPYADRGKENWLTELKKKVDPAGVADWFVIFINITQELALERMLKRNSPRDVIKVQNWDKFASKTYWGPPSCECFTVDAADSLNVKLNKALEYIR